jgi:hypothetical protein
MNRRMCSLSTVLLILAISHATSSAMAEGFTPPDGCYVGLGGSAQWTNNDFSGPTNVETDVSDSFGLNVHVGCLSGNGWAAVDLHGEWISGWDVDTPVESFEVDGGMLTASFRVYLMRMLTEEMNVDVPEPLRRFQPFLSGGMGYLSLDTPDYVGDDEDFIGRVGGGIEFFVTDRIALALDAAYVLPASKGLSNLDFLSIGWGAIYHF